MEKLNEAELVEKNQGLVWNVARKMARNEEEFQDLLQDGNIGLIEAVRRFDAKKGFAFSTYATHYIKGYIFKARREFDSEYIARTPVHWSLEEKSKFRHFSLDYSSSDEGLKLEDYISDDTALEGFNFGENEELYKAIEVLREKEKIIIHALFFENMNLLQAGKLIGVTRERARQIKEMSLDKMRRVLIGKNNSCEK